MQDGDENNNDVDIRYIVAAVESQGKQSTIRTCWRTVSKLSQCQNCIICEKSGCFNNLAEIGSPRTCCPTGGKSSSWPTRPRSWLCSEPSGSPRSLPAF